MKKDISKLVGIKKLNKSEQTKINGGTCSSPTPGAYIEPGEGAINGGQGGQLWHQNCTDSNGRSYRHTFSTSIEA